MIAMTLRIRKVSGAEKRDAKLFAGKEWKRVRSDIGYEWREKKRSFAAVEGGRTVGYAKMNMHGGMAELMQLIVSKKARGRGGGDRLLKEFEAEARRGKCHVLMIHTSERHSDAVKFYLRRGYRIAAEFKDNMFHFTWYYLEKKMRKK
jgi:GNAT superfamily N-acetyltransferase